MKKINAICSIFNVIYQVHNIINHANITIITVRIWLIKTHTINTYLFI